jgi:hypothetical protein
MELLKRVIAQRLEGSGFGVLTHDLAYSSQIAIRPKNVAAGGSRDILPHAF